MASTLVRQRQAAWWLPSDDEQALGLLADGEQPPLGRVLAWCEHPLLADGGQPRGGVLTRCEHPLLANGEQSQVGLLAGVE